MKENYLQVEKAQIDNLSSDMKVADIDNFEEDKEIDGNLKNIVWKDTCKKTVFFPLKQGDQ